MSHPPTFAEVVEAADALSIEDQEQLADLIRRRAADARRRRLVRNVREGEAEYAAGKAKAMSVEDFMREVTKAEPCPAD